MEISSPDHITAALVVRAFDERRYSDVELLCRQVLQKEQSTAWAWRYLAKLPTIDAESAIDFLSTAISIDPNDAGIYCDFSQICRQVGQMAEAVKHARRASELSPNSALAMIICAEALRDFGSEDEAWAIWGKVVGLAPSSVPAQIAYGGGLYERGRFKEAIKHLKRAVNLSPVNLEAWFLLGKSFREARRYLEALRAFETAVQINSNEGWVWFEGAKVHKISSDIENAIMWSRAAIKCNPEVSDFYIYLADNLYENRAFDEARTVSNLDVFNNYTGAQKYEIRAKIDLHFGDSLSAIKNYCEAIKLDPSNWVYLNNLASLAIEHGYMYIALEVFELVLLNDDNCEPALVNKAIIYREIMRPFESFKIYERLLNGSPSSVTYTYAGGNGGLWTNYLYSHLFVPHLDPLDVYRAHLRWGKKNIAKNGLLRKNVFKKNLGSGKIKIAYISSDLRWHSIAAFMCPVFANHDKQIFDVYVYSGASQLDFVSEVIRAQATVWRDISSLDSGSISDIIYKDQVDILIELSGHTLGNYLSVCSTRPAPIQVSYLGYPCTTGLEVINYRITDSYADPIGATEIFHTEKLVRVPDCAWCYQPLIKSDFINNFAPSHFVDYITFGCMNNLAKINDFLIQLWLSILIKVPNSRLLLKGKNFIDSEYRREFSSHFTLAGIDSSRLTLISWEPSTQLHLQSYNNIDIALDCFPYNGTTTTCEALSCGVPVVSLAGETHVSRVGLSLLTAIGLTDLVSNSAENYVKIAVELAANRERLNELRLSLPIKMKNCVLGDGLGFTKKIENCYRNMINEYNRGSF